MTVMLVVRVGGDEAILDPNYAYFIAPGVNRPHDIRLSGSEYCGAVT